LEEVPFQLAEVLHEVVALFHPIALQKGLRINTSMAAEIPEILLGDSFRLRQILTNLIGNGIKFTHQGKVDIAITCEQWGKDQVKVKFMIADTGIGIAEDKFDRLFKSFSQVDDSNNRVFGGTGLGLAIAEKLTKLMNGEIWLESKVAEGSQFYFTAIFSVPGAETAAIDIVQKEPISYKNSEFIKVLLVEDDPVSRNMVTIILKKHGFQVIAVENGQQAIEAFHEGKFDIILMDINMPYLDGYAATAIIRSKEQALNSSTPIIAMTAYALQGDKEKCLAAGMDDYISKPINFSQTIELIQKYVKTTNDSIHDKLPLL